MCLAIPGKIIEFIQADNDHESSNPKAKVSFGGLIREVSVIYVPDAKIGDYIIVHAGFAISKLNEQEAQEVFTYLEESIQNMEQN